MDELGISQANLKWEFAIPASEDLTDGRAGRQLLYAKGENYTFLQQLQFDDFSADGYQIGLFTQIPKKDDYSGWVCTYDTSYAADCDSQFQEDLTGSSVPASFESADALGSWTCSVFRDDVTNLNTALCKNVMPEEASSYPQGKFRWDPNWEQVEQWGYKQADGQATWIMLGRVSLQSGQTNYKSW